MEKETGTIAIEAEAVRRLATGSVEGIHCFLFVFETEAHSTAQIISNS